MLQILPTCTSPGVRPYIIKTSIYPIPLKPQTSLQHSVTGVWIKQIIYKCSKHYHSDKLCSNTGFKLNHEKKVSTVMLNCSTIPPISTKRTTSSCLKSLNTYFPMKIQILYWGRHKIRWIKPMLWILFEPVAWWPRYNFMW